MDIALRLAAFTVTIELPFTPPKVAVMVEVPTFLALARPLPVIDTMFVAEDCHLATPVTSCLLLSLNVACAVNCWETASGKVGLLGETAIEVAVAELTVSMVEPVIPFKLALIVVLPPETALAKPLIGALLPMVATPVSEDPQVTLPVRFCVLLSVNVPVAISCSVVWGAMVEFAGVTAIETSAGATVRLKFPVTPFSFALIMAWPAALAVTSPPEEIVAMEAFEEFQVALVVMFCGAPELNVAVAVICWVLPTTRFALCPVTWIPASTGDGLPDCVPLPPHPARVIRRAHAITIKTRRMLSLLFRKNLTPSCKEQQAIQTRSGKSRKSNYLGRVTKITASGEEEIFCTLDRTFQQS
jgi:hypothetical protein